MDWIYSCSAPNDFGDRLNVDGRFFSNRTECFRQTKNISFIDSNETESGAFIFSQNPRKGELMVRVASYKTP